MAILKNDFITFKNQQCLLKAELDEFANEKKLIEVAFF